MKYAQRGSLQDILASDELKLNTDFKLSIANDIAIGMKFLHSSQIGKKNLSVEFWLTNMYFLYFFMYIAL